MIRLEERHLQPELMDDPKLPESEHQQALRGLERVHRVSGTTGRLWRTVLRAMPASATDRPWRILDVGCGDAFVLRGFAQRAASAGRSVELIGCDFSRTALQLARRAAAADGVELELHQVDVLQQTLPIRADVIMCSLFLHHFQNAQILQILVNFRRNADSQVIIEDLVRSWQAYWLCRLGVRLLTRSHVVHIDGPLSVRAGFRESELRRLLEQAEMGDAKINRRWPQRLLIEWQSKRESDSEQQ